MFLVAASNFFGREFSSPWNTQDDDRDVAWVGYVTLPDLDLVMALIFVLGLATGMGADRVDRSSGFAANRGEA